MNASRTSVLRRAALLAAAAVVVCAATNALAQVPSASSAAPAAADAGGTPPVVPSAAPGDASPSAGPDAVAAASPSPSDDEAPAGSPDPGASPDPFHGLDLIMAPPIAPHLLLEPQTKRDPFLAPAGVPSAALIPVKPPPTVASLKPPEPVQSSKPAPPPRPSRIKTVSSLAISGVMFGEHVRAVRIGGKRVHEGEWFDIVGGRVSVGDGGEFQVLTITPTRIVFADRSGGRVDRDTSLRRQRVTAAPVESATDAGEPDR